MERAVTRLNKGRKGDGLTTDPLLLINDITLELSRTYNSDELLEKIIDFALEVTGGKTGSLMLIEPEADILEIRVLRGFSDRVQRNVKLPVGQGITGQVARTGQPILANDVTQNKYYFQIKKNIKSEIAVPLTVEGEVIGVISVDSTRLNNFTEDHLTLLSILASQAAQIFKNLEVLHRLENQNKIQETLLKISRKLGDSLNLKESFREIMGILEQELAMERGTILLYSEKKGRLEIVEGVGLSEGEKARGFYHPGEGITGKVYSSGQAYFIRDISNDSRFINKTGSRRKSPSRPVSFFCCPIRLDNEIVGVLSLDHDFDSESDFQILSKFTQILSSILAQALKIESLVREEKKKLELENVILKREIQSRYTFKNIIGKSARMEELFNRINMVSDSRANILISGENGTGKELVASAIHYNSSRADRPLVKMNCASIPESLLESELFGHKKGAFTGAVADKKGKFEVADGGTLFLDEIGDMDLSLQAKLLRVLQEREVEPVGSLRPVKVDVRIIAATNRNLEEMVASRQFREDLYYRLNVIRLNIPSLRERLTDIPLLVNYFLQKYGPENGKDIQGLTRDAMRKLQSYDWPGNIRQLENMIERAVILSQSPVLQPEDFDFSESGGRMLARENALARDGGRELPVPLEQVELAGDLDEIFENYDGNVYEKVIQEVERVLIRNALKKFRYVKVRTAQFLGINRNTLDKKIRELKIDY